MLYDISSLYPESPENGAVMAGLLTYSLFECLPILNVVNSG
jgi:hypothetical protein